MVKINVIDEFNDDEDLLYSETFTLADKENYYKNYIKNAFDSNIERSEFDKTINELAEEAAKWTEGILFYDKPSVGTLLSKDIRLKNRTIEISCQPDLWTNRGGRLILIEYKFRSVISKNYYLRLIFYAGIICEQDPKICCVDLYIKYPDGYDVYKLNRAALMAQYQLLIEKIIKYSNKETTSGSIDELEKLLQ